MSQTASTSTWESFWNFDMSWRPRSPTPMAPRLMRSLAPLTREYESAVAAETPRRKLHRSRLVSDIRRLYPLGETQAARVSKPEAVRTRRPGGPPAGAWRPRVADGSRSRYPARPLSPRVHRGG